MTHTLGIEFGSTRIKAVLIDEAFRPVASGDYTWKSDLRDGVWTYDLEEAWSGLRTALRALGEVSVDAMGISAMMHGYLAFDKDWNLLTPFRTWQNTMTGEEAAELTELFGFIRKVINKVTLFGAIYLGIIAVLPVLLGTIMSNTRFSFGGTSIIIVVSVALETVAAIEAQMLMRNYSGFLEK